MTEKTSKSNSDLQELRSLCTISDAAWPSGIGSVFWQGNLLECLPEQSIWAESCMIAAWSGWFGEETQGVYEADPRLWLGKGDEMLHGQLDQIHKKLGGADGVVGEFLLRPHARHVLSDHLACQRYLQERPSDKFGLLLDPVAMLEPSMLPDARDHLIRTREALGEHARALIVSNVNKVSDGLVSCALDAGELDSDMLREQFQAYPSDLPRFTLY